MYKNCESRESKILRKYLTVMITMYNMSQSKIGTLR